MASLKHGASVRIVSSPEYPAFETVGEIVDIRGSGDGAEYLVVWGPETPLNENQAWLLGNEIERVAKAKR